MNDLAIWINAHNRRHVFHKALSRLFSVKSPGSKVYIVDDGSEYGHEFPEGVSPSAYIRIPNNLGPGGARRAAIKLAFGTDAKEFLFMDCDLYVSPGFDVVPRELWHSKRGLHCQCSGSPLRPDKSLVGHSSREIEYAGYVYGSTITGQAMFMDRNLCDMALHFFPEDLWGYWWDWAIGGFILGMIGPIESFAKDIGDDNQATHK